MTGRPNHPAPIYVRLAELIADEILAGKYTDGQLVPSSNDLAHKFHINPATAARALNVLVQLNVLEIRRGVGTAVARGGQAVIADLRRRTFVARRIQPLRTEASALGISIAEVHCLLDDAGFLAPSFEELRFTTVLETVTRAI
jgi:DNA-binding transcriptional regulator YhcF (GntR family)